MVTFGGKLKTEAVAAARGRQPEVDVAVRGKQPVVVGDEKP